MIPHAIGGGQLSLPPPGQVGPDVSMELPLPESAEEAPVDHPISRRPHRPRLAVSYFPSQQRVRAAAPRLSSSQPNSPAPAAVVRGPHISQRLSRKGRGAMPMAAPLPPPPPLPSKKGKKRRLQLIGATSARRAVAARMVAKRLKPRRTTWRDRPRISLPEHWFLDPLYADLRSKMHPPTSKMTRRLISVSRPMPIELFYKFMAPLEDNAQEMIERDESGMLTPTRKTASTDWYEYLLCRPTAYDKMFALERADKKKYPLSHGCAHLQLSLAAARRGCLASEISLPFGNVSVVLAAPRRERKMPTCTIRMFVMTMQASGHIRWPFQPNPRTRSMLRKMAHQKVQAMLDSERPYPVTQGFGKPTASETGTDSFNPLQVYRTSTARPRPLPQNPRNNPRFLLLR